jgi:predicted RNA-binding protein YlxR (DUF448 family)
VKYVPTRKCVVCNGRFDKNSLVRAAKNKDGEIALDRGHSLPGRGAYICKSPVCRSNLIKKNALNRSFRQKVPQSVLEVIINELDGQ